MAGKKGVAEAPGTSVNGAGTLDSLERPLTLEQVMKVACRTCGCSSEPGVNLLQPQHARLCKWFTRCLVLEINEENRLPHRVCLDCLAQVQGWIAFTSRCREIQNKVNILVQDLPTDNSKPSPEKKSASPKSKKKSPVKEEPETVNTRQLRQKSKVTTPTKSAQSPKKPSPKASVKGKLKGKNNLRRMPKREAKKKVQDGIMYDIMFDEIMASDNSTDSPVEDPSNAVKQETKPKTPRKQRSCSADYAASLSPEPKKPRKSRNSFSPSKPAISEPATELDTLTRKRGRSVGRGAKSEEPPSIVIKEKDDIDKSPLKDGNPSVNKAAVDDTEKKTEQNPQHVAEPPKGAGNNANTPVGPVLTVPLTPGLKEIGSLQEKVLAKATPTRAAGLHGSAPTAASSHHEPTVSSYPVSLGSQYGAFSNSAANSLQNPPPPNQHHFGQATTKPDNKTEALMSSCKNYKPKFRLASKPTSTTPIQSAPISPNVNPQFPLASSVHPAVYRAIRPMPQPIPQVCQPPKSSPLTSNSCKLTPSATVTGLNSTEQTKFAVAPSVEQSSLIIEQLTQGVTKREPPPTPQPHPLSTPQPPLLSTPQPPLLATRQPANAQPQMPQYQYINNQPNTYIAPRSYVVVSNPGYNSTPLQHFQTRASNYHEGVSPSPPYTPTPPYTPSPSFQSVLPYGSSQYTLRHPTPQQPPQQALTQQTNTDYTRNFYSSSPMMVNRAFNPQAQSPVQYVYSQTSTQQQATFYSQVPTAPTYNLYQPQTSPQVQGQYYSGETPSNSLLTFNSPNQNS